MEQVAEAEGVAPAVTEAAPDSGAAPAVTEAAPDSGAAPAVTEAASDSGAAPAVTEAAPDSATAPAAPQQAPVETLVEPSNRELFIYLKKHGTSLPNVSALNNAATKAKALEQYYALQGLTPMSTATEAPQPAAPKPIRHVWVAWTSRPPQEVTVPTLPPSPLDPATVGADRRVPAEGYARLQQDASYPDFFQQLTQLEGLETRSVDDEEEARAWLQRPRAVFGLVTKPFTAEHINAVPVTTLQPGNWATLPADLPPAGILYTVTPLTSCPLWRTLSKCRPAHFREYKEWSAAVAWLQETLTLEENARQQDELAANSSTSAANVEAVPTTKSAGDCFEVGRAVSQGNVTRYRELVRARPDRLIVEGESLIPTRIRQFGPDKTARGNALHVAAEDGREDLVRAILEEVVAFAQHSDLAANMPGKTMEQARAELLDCVMTSYLQSPYSVYGDPVTPAMLAARKGRLGTLKILLSCGRFSRVADPLYKSTLQWLIEHYGERSSAAESEVIAERNELQQFLVERTFVAITKPTAGHGRPKIVTWNPDEPLSRQEAPQGLLAWLGPTTAKRAMELQAAFQHSPDNTIAEQQANRLKAALTATEPGERENQERASTTNGVNPSTPTTGTPLGTPTADTPSSIQRAAEWHEYRTRRRDDPGRGLQQYGRVLSKQSGVPFAEYWPFLGTYADLSTLAGLEKLEAHLRTHHHRFLAGRYPGPSDADAFLAAREEPSLQLALGWKPESRSRLLGKPWDHLVRLPHVWGWALYFQSLFDLSVVDEAVVASSEGPASLEAASPTLGAPGSPLRSKLHSLRRSESVAAPQSPLVRRALLNAQASPTASPGSPRLAGTRAASPVVALRARIHKLHDASPDRTSSFDNNLPARTSTSQPDPYTHHQLGYSLLDKRPLLPYMFCPPEDIAGVVAEEEELGGKLAALNLGNN